MNQTQSLPKQLWPFFLHFIRPYKRYVAGILIVDIIWALHVPLFPYIFKLLVDCIVHYQNNADELKRVIIWPAIAYVGFSFLIGIVFRFNDYINLKFIPNLKADIQEQMLFYLEGHSYKYFQNNFAGSLSNKIADMVRGIPEIIAMLGESYITSFLAIIIGAISMYLVQPVFAYIILIWAIIYVYMSFLLSHKGKVYAIDLAESISALNGKRVDSIGNITNVRLFATKKFEMNYIRKFMNETIAKDQKIGWYILKTHIFQFISITIMGAFMLLFLIKSRINGSITAGDFVLILTLNIRLIDNLWSATSQFVRFAREIGNCKQALSIISPNHEINDVKGARDLIITKGEIAFDNVTFGYYDDNNIFQNENITINPGQKIGLVGFSGSGKTTFVHLILRFFDVKSGHILIDNQDISTVTQDSLHNAIAMIPQDTSLFHRSLIENIRYGAMQSTDEQVIEASKKAHCHEFITQLPNGYDSLVGERGIKLSGGQRQRIAIARAILKNSPILILDEATSSLDSVTERYIQDGLHELMKNRTTIVIAHRLSTLSEMDRILVFSNGHIIEDGSHTALLANNGHYAKMWHMQSQGFLPDEDDAH